jgi:membrane protein implicated in regulation of membrane protease activity
MENDKKTNFFSLPKSKWLKIVFGIILIFFELITYDFYLPVSGEAIGADIVPFAILVLGIWLIYLGVKQK